MKWEEKMEARIIRQTTIVALLPRPFFVFASLFPVSILYRAPAAAFYPVNDYSVFLDGDASEHAD